MTFDLIEEPWVLVSEHGEVREVGLREAFERSQEIARLAGEVPTQEAAMLRLMVAILYRALPIEGGQKRAVTAWGQWWRADRLPAEVMNYLAAHHDRFDLFDHEKPFLQVSDLQANGTSGLMSLVADVPPKSAYFTTRAGDQLERLSAAEAARWLVHCQAFDPSGIKTGAVGDDRVKGGKGYPIGTGWSGNLGLILVEGATLKDTLLLNLALVLFSDPDDDRPVWERPPLTSAVEDEHELPHGPADVLTWPSRRIRLIGGRDGVVDVIRSNGDALHPRNQFGVEPHTGWRRSANQEKQQRQAVVYMPQTHSLERGLWRGLRTLLPLDGTTSRGSDASSHLAPAVLAWIATLQENEILPTGYPLRLRAVGVEYGTQSAVVSAMIDDRLRVRADLLSDARLKKVVTEGVERAEGVAQLIGNLARNLERACGRDGEAARTRVTEQAYHLLGTRFATAVADLTSASDTNAWAQAWDATVKAVALGLERELVTSAPDEVFVGRDIEINAKGKPASTAHLDIGLAVRWFRDRLHALIPDPQPHDSATEPTNEQEGRTT